MEVENKESLSLDARIEAVLFYKNEPISFQKLSEILKVREEEILGGLSDLESRLEGGGVALVRTENEASLATASGCSTLIETVRKQELSSDLGKATLETLSLVLYRGPISRPDIDYVRGVNSQFILRRLLVRGLIEKDSNPKNRGYLYRPSIKLLTHLGISNLKDLPEYEKVQESFLNMLASHADNDVVVKEDETEETKENL